MFLNKCDLLQIIRFSNKFRGHFREFYAFYWECVCSFHFTLNRWPTINSWAFKKPKSLRLVRAMGTNRWYISFHESIIKFHCFLGKLFFSYFNINYTWNIAEHLFYSLNCRIFNTFCKNQICKKSIFPLIFI